MGIRIEVPEERIAAFCERYGVVELAFFGSVLRDDFGPESDIDVLVRFHPESHRDFATMQTMREDLSCGFKREVQQAGRCRRITDSVF